MEIRQYSKADETLLFDLLIDEGDDWIDYHGSVGRSKYIKALESSITYIASLSIIRQELEERILF